VHAAEHAVVFDCEGEPCVALLHVPATPRAVGLLAVAAGGIQYRAGCGRQLVSLARALAADGTPVMRFDHRGHGDSGGELLGFQHMEQDLRRAVAVFREQVPGLSHVVLYGGCEAASAIMMNACDIPAVRSVILANPWVDSTTARAAATRQHYRRRLGDREFWRKLCSGGYNPLDYLPGLLRNLREKLAPRAKAADAPGPRPFEERMLEGLQRFDGRVLLLKSGQSLFSEEFDQLVAGSPDWQRACARPGIRRQEFPDADQTFSTAASRRDLGAAAAAWVAEMAATPGN